MEGQRSLQAASTPAIAGGMDLAVGGVVHDDGLYIKQELEDTDIDVGPTVLQYMDAHYRPNQPDMSIVKQESTISDDTIKPMPCGGVKEEIIEKAWRDTQHSKMETPPKPRTQWWLYRCDMCPKVFQCITATNAHRKHMHGTGSYECTECNVQFKCRQNLKRHFHNKHSEQQYECTICNKMYACKQALCRHVALCHRRSSAVSSPVVYTCGYCQKTCNRMRYLVTHMDIVHGIAFCVCAVCKIDLKSEHCFMRHINMVHSKKEYKCEICKKIFAYKQNYNRHVRQVNCRAMSSGTSGHSDIKGGRSLQAASTPAIAGGMDVAVGGVVHDDGLYIKQELEDTDIDVGPTVLQYRDAHYRPNQLKVSVVKQESTINDNWINPMQCGGVKKIIGEKRRVFSMAKTNAERCRQYQMRKKAAKGVPVREKKKPMTSTERNRAYRQRIKNKKKETILHESQSFNNGTPSVLSSPYTCVVIPVPSLQPVATTIILNHSKSPMVSDTIADKVDENVRDSSLSTVTHDNRNLITVQADLNEQSSPVLFNCLTTKKKVPLTGTERSRRCRARRTNQQSGCKK